MGSFAGWTVTGNEFFVAESMIFVRVFEFVVRSVNLIEFMSDFFKKRLFQGSTDADTNFFFVVVFDDFGAAIFVGEDYTFFPD